MTWRHPFPIEKLTVKLPVFLADSNLWNRLKQKSF